MAPLDMHTSMSLVQIPTTNATVCGLLREQLTVKGWSVSGWTAVGSEANPIPCSFRLSAQVYLEQADFVELGALTLQILKNVTG